MNQANQFILAIVLIDGDSYQGPYYLKKPFNQEPDFGVASINYDLEELLSRATCEQCPLDVPDTEYQAAVSVALSEWNSLQDDEDYRNL